MSHLCYYLIHRFGLLIVTESFAAVISGPFYSFIQRHLYISSNLFIQLVPKVLSTWFILEWNRIIVNRMEVSEEKGNVWKRFVCVRKPRGTRMSCMAAAYRWFQFECFFLGLTTRWKININTYGYSLKNVLEGGQSEIGSIVQKGRLVLG